jgi:hypothetical protein
MSTDCPEDAYAVGGTACNQPCEQPASCTGKSAACPATSLQAKGYVCEPHGQAGACSADATCDGVTPVCPEPAPASKGTPCSGSGADPGCTAGTSACDGVNLTCPSVSSCALADGQPCTVGQPPACQSGICSGSPSVCQSAPSCLDGMKNGAETDTDCGGPVCPRCGAHQACAVDSDCASGTCSSNTCAG